MHPQKQVLKGRIILPVVLTKTFCMIKIKVGKIKIISFIGLIIVFFIGIGGNFILKAGLPSSVSKTEINFENRLQQLEDDLQAGTISRNEYDSLVQLLRIQKSNSETLTEVSHFAEELPEWVIALGISEPENMKFDPVFSDYTSVDDPAEGFNSVSLVYNGSYNDAMKEAARIAAETKLYIGNNFKAKGAPAVKSNQLLTKGICYLNYSLDDTDKDFLISVEVEPSGRLNIIVTDNKQLNNRLLVYTPLNNRQNSESKPKKQ